jgi:ankyrin repeat protein
LLLTDVSVAAAMNVIRAATEGDVETVKQWLTAPHTRHPGQVVQVLEGAARYGHVNIICQLMLDSGQVPEGAISVALYTACRYNQQSTAQLLIRHGHINTHDLTDALLAACVFGHMRIVVWLISDVMQLSHSDRIKWLLTTSCARGDLSAIKQLATRVDSDVTLVSQALRVACYNGRDDVVKWLMTHTTADVNSLGVINDVRGEVTSLMVACDNGHNDIVRRLLQCVTPHTVNMMSGAAANTALHFAICYETEKRSPMQAGCIDSDIVTVTATLYLNNVNLQIAGDSTALHWACTRGDVEIVRMLLSAFADTHITDDERRTPAMEAEQNGHTELLLHLQCILPATTDIPSTNNNSVSISLVSVTGVTQHNTPHTNRSRPDTTSKITTQANIRFV